MPDTARTAENGRCPGPSGRNVAEINAVLAATGDQPIVEVSTRDPWWRARPIADRYEGKNVPGRLWMELRQQLRDRDPAAHSHGWLDHIHIGRLAGSPVIPCAAPAAG